MGEWITHKVGVEWQTGAIIVIFKLAKKRCYWRAPWLEHKWSKIGFSYARGES